ncbi:MAG: ATP-dependent protease ATPase subunit HslU [Candidatus Marinimicrobia bacterium]|nr:ATP-dependent protease ATPase subunit HslU [Candidatus Neomarinimicrobiota bacterium]
MKNQELTPKQIVKELDNYIIGQDKAKRAVAIAMRNRWRRQQVQGEIKDDILPNNIILIGPTGVGKTEIARRLSNLARAPFVKVEASKFTEVGYVGRSVETMIRDLASNAINLVKAERMKEVEEQAKQMAEERILDHLLPSKSDSEDLEQKDQHFKKTREKFRKMLENGELEDRVIEISVRKSSNPTMQIFGPSGLEEMGMNIKEIIGNAFPNKKKKRRVTVEEAREIFQEVEAEKMIDMDRIKEQAINRTEESGIVFLDEIDKIAATSDSSQGKSADVSREGVQRDILPIVEGTNVQTKYGTVKTDHILFVAAGAFHMSKPSDLIPELQGRFPIRQELSSLGKEEFVKILQLPKNALLKQYQALLETEDVDLAFEEDAVSEIASIAEKANNRMENIGARRLHTVLSTLLDEILFEVPDKKHDTINITKQDVVEKLADLIEDKDLSRYVL